ncbi:MAG: CoA transferase [Myxococcales bacterium]|nr:CoA transferase [Myxococcales bacterium]
MSEPRHPLPLEGVRILAVEQMQAVPFATQLMAHLGAEVVKVEHPEHGESGRTAAPSIPDADGRPAGATFLRNNLCKRSLGLDLKNPKGAALLKRLVPHYDVVAENFRPGTMEKFGLGYDELAKLHPGLVYVAVSGFGSLHDSPYRSWPAYAAIPEAMGGFYSFRPEPGRLPNIGVAGALGDITSALFATIGAIAALRGRDRTGVGQKVDIAMLDAVMAMMDMVPFNPTVGVMDNSIKSWPGILSCFHAKDGLFVMQVGREHQFERLAHAIGKPEWLDDPRFATREGWRDHTDGAIREAIEAWAADKTKLAASQALADAGVVAGPSYEADDLERDAHVALRDMILRIPRPDGKGAVHIVGNPVKLSRSTPREPERWPTIGRDTRDLLRADLGLSDGDLDALRSDGVIG